MNSLFTSPSLITWSTNWVFHSHPQNTSGWLTPSLKYNLPSCNQLEKSHDNTGTFKFILTAQNLLQNSLSVPSFKQRSMKLFPPYFFFLWKHGFWIFLPDFLHLNSFIPLAMPCPLKTAFLCFHRKWSKVRLDLQNPCSPPCFSEKNWKKWREFR